MRRRAQAELVIPHGIDDSSDAMAARCGTLAKATSCVSSALPAPRRAGQHSGCKGPWDCEYLDSSGAKEACAPPVTKPGRISQGTWTCLSLIETPCHACRTHRSSRRRRSHKWLQRRFCRQQRRFIFVNIFNALQLIRR
jgi:hypothetical protein